MFSFVHKNTCACTTIYDGHSIDKNIFYNRKIICFLKGAMDCGIVVSVFVFQSRYYVHFWANTFGKGMNPVILPAMS